MYEHMNGFAKFKVKAAIRIVYARPQTFYTKRHIRRR
jgi:hypothetical protein